MKNIVDLLFGKNDWVTVWRNAISFYDNPNHTYYYVITFSKTRMEYRLSVPKFPNSNNCVLYEEAVGVLNKLRNKENLIDYSDILKMIVESNDRYKVDFEQYEEITYLKIMILGDIGNLINFPYPTVEGLSQRDFIRIFSKIFIIDENWRTVKI